MEHAEPFLIATVLDTTDARGLAEFYRRLLGFDYAPGDEPPPPGEPDTRASVWLVLNDSDGSPRLAFQAVSELERSTWPDPRIPQQLHLDLGVRSLDDLGRQTERAMTLGAVVLEDRRHDPDESLVVLADPQGHPFCLIVAGSPSASEGHSGSQREM